MKHDENKDLQSIAKIAQSINKSEKTITISKYAIIGIRRWSKLDYLRHHCGWFVRIDKTTPVKGNKRLLIQTENVYVSDIDTYKKERRNSRKNNINE